VSDPFYAYRRSYSGASPTLRQTRMIRRAVLRRQWRSELLGLSLGLGLIMFMIALGFLSTSAVEQRASGVPLEWVESAGGSEAAE
jgi:hypothetical protein